ncbi:hypothetical protein VD0002_g2560 [Verticillium dahliae]|uniref:Uncharacterized protein n=1 Tax=Verticillium dahliae TaxID=27337 RepID=A0AA45AID3_VERDA|nr:hypothetical protein BJF96_g8196 [Verticillium dahliae]PNH45453.1 hypothetical protein VD0004_g2478 [Verticillium dahliae]PNH53520.1 hypothetical protein VD0003_g3906 [Verticillium dahliae]PNH67006.1 hypothetical protein VD0002_g2560 [Verticillium dahliae]PNH71685.1 hypothetical protein VD0001_g5853 [Verticillium dahliae]
MNKVPSSTAKLEGSPWEAHVGVGAPLFETASVESPAGRHKSAVTSSRPFSLSVWNPFENNAHHIFSSTTFDPIIEVVTTSMHNTI